MLIAKWRRGAGTDGKRLPQALACVKFREHGIEWTAARLAQIEAGDLRKPSDRVIEAIAKTTGHHRAICYFYSNSIPPELRPASADYELMMKVQAALSILYEFFGCEDAGPPRPPGMTERYGFIFESTDPLVLAKRSVPDKKFDGDPTKIFG